MDENDYAIFGANSSHALPESVKGMCPYQSSFLCLSVQAWQYSVLLHAKPLPFLKIIPNGVDTDDVIHCSRQLDERDLAFGAEEVGFEFVPKSCQAAEVSFGKDRVGLLLAAQ